VISVSVLWVSRMRGLLTVGIGEFIDSNNDPGSFEEYGSQLMSGQADPEELERLAEDICRRYKSSSRPTPTMSELQELADTRQCALLPTIDDTPLWRVPVQVSTYFFYSIFSI
jgi:hypothetical protein